MKSILRLVEWRSCLRNLSVASSTFSSNREYLIYTKILYKDLIKLWWVWRSFRVDSTETARRVLQRRNILLISIMATRHSVRNVYEAGARTRALTAAQKKALSKGERDARRITGVRDAGHHLSHRSFPSSLMKAEREAAKDRDEIGDERSRCPAGRPGHQVARIVAITLVGLIVMQKLTRWLTEW